MVLCSVDTWEIWCSDIQDYDDSGVWKYLDPAVKDEDLPTPPDKQPRPRPEDYIANRGDDPTKAITKHDLSSGEKEKYERGLYTFRWRLRMHKRRMKFLLDMICRSLPPWAARLIAGEVQPRRILLILQSRFKRTEEEQLTHRWTVRSKWDHMKAHTGLDMRRKVTAWCEQWVSLYMQVSRLGIFCYDEDPIHDFLDAIKTFDFEFWREHSRKLRRGETVDFVDMVGGFRRMHTYAFSILRNSTDDEEDEKSKKQRRCLVCNQGHVTSECWALNGKEAPKEKRRCLACNQSHFTTKCWALNRQEAPKSWTLREKTRSCMKRNLLDDDICQDIIETYHWNRPKVKIECLIEDFWYWEGRPYPFRGGIYEHGGGNRNN